MKFKSIALVAAASLSLAACSGGSEEQPVAAANITESAVSETTTTNIVTETAEPAPAPVVNRVVAEEAPAPTLSVDEQTQDDAAATGMTAKVNRDETGSEEQPAQ